MQERICANCNKVLPIKNEVQSGYYCCDEYYCSKQCVNMSLGDGQDFATDHYTEDGDCYFTEWEE